jgi:NAD(P)-dependent dehydrogenase (short-subunit alcohol dehydrogenase family)
VEATAGNITEDFLPLEVDGLDEGSIADSFQTTGTTFGRIDVVVNNAGLGAPDTRSTVIPQALSYLSRQGHGHIVNITAFGAGDIAAFGTDDIAAPAAIHYTTVTRGVFQSQSPGHDPLPADTLYVPIDGRQIADPVKAAAALIRLAAMPQPPSLLVFGSNAYNKAQSVDAIRPRDCRFTTASE